jgi:hypothetical protein
MNRLQFLMILVVVAIVVAVLLWMQYQPATSP